MSCQKGNAARSRPQKHKNVTRYENDKYDTSKQTKSLNSMNISSLCEHCKSIIQWKIQFKKYKPLTVPKKCIKCEQKSVKKSYHTICDSCSEKLGVCAKCDKEYDTNNESPTTL